MGWYSFGLGADVAVGMQPAVVKAVASAITKPSTSIQPTTVVSKTPIAPTTNPLIISTRPAEIISKPLLTPVVTQPSVRTMQAEAVAPGKVLIPTAPTTTTAVRSPSMSTSTTKTATSIGGSATTTFTPASASMQTLATMGTSLFTPPEVKPAALSTTVVVPTTTTVKPSVSLAPTVDLTFSKPTTTLPVLPAPTKMPPTTIAKDPIVEAVKATVKTATLEPVKLPTSVLTPVKLPSTTPVEVVKPAAVAPVKAPILEPVKAPVVEAVRDALPVVTSLPPAKLPPRAPLVDLPPTQQQIDAAPVLMSPGVVQTSAGGGGFYYPSGGGSSVRNELNVTINRLNPICAPGTYYDESLFMCMPEAGSGAAPSLPVMQPVALPPAARQSASKSWLWLLLVAGAGWYAYKRWF